MVEELAIGNTQSANSIAYYQLPVAHCIMLQ
jgi:hypothetical protein